MSKPRSDVSFTDTSRTWLSRNAFQVCELWRGLALPMYRETVASDTSIPSIPSSPWILGAPHSGFASAMQRIKSRSDLSILGRPGPGTDFFAQ